MHPPSTVIIVNGVPGSGKSTLARRLARALNLPLLSKDAVKETLLDNLPVADRVESRRLGAAAGEVLWTVLEGCPRGAVLDSWLSPQIRGQVRAGLARASCSRHVEIWCACPDDEVRRRFALRASARHPGHFDQAFLADFDAVLASAEPLGLGSVITVRTDEVVDLGTLINAVTSAV